MLLALALFGSCVVAFGAHPAHAETPADSIPATHKDRRNGINEGSVAELPIGIASLASHASRFHHSTQAPISSIELRCSDQATNDDRWVYDNLMFRRRRIVRIDDDISRLWVAIGPARDLASTDNHTPPAVPSGFTPKRKGGAGCDNSGYVKDRLLVRGLVPDGVVETDSTPNGPVGSDCASLVFRSDKFLR
jgi:hypothetical protein